MRLKDTKVQVGTERDHGSRKETCDGSCPIGKLIELLSGRWAFPVLYQLLEAEGPIRFGQLQRSVGRVTQKELTKTLRVFEERGLVKRHIYAEIPPRVEYPSSCSRPAIRAIRSIRKTTSSRTYSSPSPPRCSPSCAKSEVCSSDSPIRPCDRCPNVSRLGHYPSRFGHAYQVLL